LLLLLLLALNAASRAVINLLAGLAAARLAAERLSLVIQRTV